MEVEALGAEVVRANAGARMHGPAWSIAGVDAQAVSTQPASHTGMKSLFILSFSSGVEQRAGALVWAKIALSSASNTGARQGPGIACGAFGGHVALR